LSRKSGGAGLRRIFKSAGGTTSKASEKGKRRKGGGEEKKENRQKDLRARTLGEESERKMTSFAGGKHLIGDESKNQTMRGGSGPWGEKRAGEGATYVRQEGDFRSTNLRRFDNIWRGKIGRGREVEKLCTGISDLI